MQPRKDYEDYSRFINDTYADEKIGMLTRTVDIEGKRGTITKFYNPINNLRTYSEYPQKPQALKSGFNTAKHSRSYSLKA